MATLDDRRDGRLRIGNDGGRRAIGSPGKRSERFQSGHCRRLRFRAGRVSALLEGRWRSPMPLGRQRTHLWLPRLCPGSSRLRVPGSPLRGASRIRLPASSRIRLRRASRILRCRSRVRLRSSWCVRLPSAGVWLSGASRLRPRSNRPILSTVDGLRQSQPVSLGLACVVVRHEPPGSWRAAGLDSSCR